MQSLIESLTSQKATVEAELQVRPRFTSPHFALQRMMTLGPHFTSPHLTLQRMLTLGMLLDFTVKSGAAAGDAVVAASGPGEGPGDRTAEGARRRATHTGNHSTHITASQSQSPSIPTHPFCAQLEQAGQWQGMGGSAMPSADAMDLGLSPINPDRKSVV